MAKRLKVTGFARFILFILIAAPLIYSGAAMIKGEHPLDAAKRDLGIDLRGSDKVETVETPKSVNDDTADLIDMLKDQNRELKNEVKELKDKLKDCQ